MAVQKENKAIETQKKKPLELKPRNEKFVQLYAISGNATQSYIEAYGLDKNNISQYMGCLLSTYDVSDDLTVVDLIVSRTTKNNQYISTIAT